nr:DUF6254 family protein [uncultured Bacillus sp.]
MSKSKKEKDRAWEVRKQNQRPHGKVKKLKELIGEGRESQ